MGPGRLIGSGVNVIRSSSAGTMAAELLTEGAASATAAGRGWKQAPFLHSGVRMRERARRCPASRGPGQSDAGGCAIDASSRAAAAAAPSRECICSESLSGCAHTALTISADDIWDLLLMDPFWGSHIIIKVMHEMLTILALQACSISQPSTEPQNQGWMKHLCWWY